MATRHISWPLLLPIYLLLTTLPPLTTLHQTLLHEPPRPPILPPILTLLSSLSLLPSLPSLRPSPPRLALLAIFLVSLTTLLISLLRSLPALSTLLHPPPSPPHTHPSILPLLPPLLLLIPLHLSPSLRILRTAAPQPLRILLPPLPGPRGATTSTPRRAEPAPALLAVLLHVSVTFLSALSESLSHLLTPTLSSFITLISASASAALALPLLKLSLRVLVQGAPARVAAGVRRAVDKLALVDGVLRCQNVRVWEEALGVFVATLSVVVQKDADSRFVLNQAVKIFDGVVNDLTVQVETVRDEVAQGVAV